MSVPGKVAKRVPVRNPKTGKTTYAIRYVNTGEEANEQGKTNTGRGGYSDADSKPGVSGESGTGSTLEYGSSDRRDFFEQYRRDGVLVGRESITSLPEKNHLSSDIAGILRQHQKDFVNLALEKFEQGMPGVFNFDGTGTGKTLQELALAEQYSRDNPTETVFVVTENEAIIENAIIRGAARLGTEVTYAKSQKDLSGPGVYAMTYTALAKFADSRPGLVVFDEAHNMKNKSKKQEAGMALADKAKHKVYFTATPMDKAEHIEYVCNGLGLSFDATMNQLGYQQQVAEKKESAYWVRKVGAKEYAKRLQGFFDSLTKDGLASKREVSMANVSMNMRTVQLSPEDEKQYLELQKRYEDGLDSVSKFLEGKYKAMGLLALRRAVEAMKVDAAVQSIEKGVQEGKQVVVFADRINDSDIKFMGETSSDKLTSPGTLQEIEARLKEKGITYAGFYGEGKSKDAVQSFQKGQVQVFLTTPQSGGTGISLDDSQGIAPRKEVILSPPFSAMQFVQMAGRVNRLNTKSPAEIEVLLTKHSVDSWGAGIIAGKMQTLGASVSGEYARLNDEQLQQVVDLPENAQQEYIERIQSQQAQTGPFPVVADKTPGGFDSSQATKSAAVNKKRNLMKRGKPIIEQPIARATSMYSTYIPKDKDGNFAVTQENAMPDAKLGPGFGEYSGKNLSSVAKSNPEYVMEFLNEQMGKPIIARPEQISELTWQAKYE